MHVRLAAGTLHLPQSAFIHVYSHNPTACPHSTTHRSKAYTRLRCAGGTISANAGLLQQGAAWQTAAEHAGGQAPRQNTCCCLHTTACQKLHKAAMPMVQCVAVCGRLCSPGHAVSSAQADMMKPYSQTVAGSPFMGSAWEERGHGSFSV